jgi:hypothetical protein
VAAGSALPVAADAASFAILAVAGATVRGHRRTTIGWGAALTPLGLLRLPIAALACFAAGGLLYAPYPALSATLFQRESPPELLSQSWPPAAR